jgi:hypothetical protein
MKKLNEPKTKQALEKVAQYVDEKVAALDQKDAIDRIFYTETLSDEFEPGFLDNLLQGEDVDLSAVAPEKLPLLQDVIVENFCDQSDRLDATLCMLTADLPTEVREIAIDYVNDRVEMRAKQAVSTLTRIGHILETTGRTAVAVGKVAVVGAAHLLDPIPGAPIGRSIEVLTGTPVKEAYSGMSSDAEQDYAVSQSMAASFAGIPALQVIGGIVGKVFMNIGRASQGVQRVLLKHSTLLRNVQIRNYERRIGKAGSTLDKLSQKHHVLPQGSTDVAALCERAGLDINDAHNILRLPNKAGARMKIFGRATIHEGRHNEKYMKAVKDKVGKIIETGEKSHFSHEQYRSETYKLIDEFKSQLISGELPLNSLARLK